MADLSHFDEHGASRMVDVGAKPMTERRAIADDQDHRRFCRAQRVSLQRERRVPFHVSPAPTSCAPGRRAVRRDAP